MFMGKISDIYCSPADADRALRGFRYALIPFGDAVRPSDPCCLRTVGATRSACPLHVALLCSHVLRARRGLDKGLYGLATASPSRGRGAARGCASRRTAGRAVVLETIFVIVPLSLIALRSRPSLLSRSMAAGLDRLRCAPPATRHASGRDCALKPLPAVAF